MERIKNALDKARQQAGGLARHGGAPGAADLRQHPAAAAGASSDTTTAPLAPSRIESLDPAHLEDHRIVSFDQSHPSRWAFDLLRTQVLQRMAEKGWKTIAVTSPTVNSGKTVVAINLAMSIAHHPQHSATLVDFDLRRPRIGAYLGLAQGPSMSDVLTAGVDLSQAVVNVGLPKLAVLPTFRSVPGASEILTSSRTGQIIASLRAGPATSITIFDLPPVTAVDDVIAVLPRIDCVLLVIGNGMSTRREIQEAQRHLARSQVIGTVLNKAAAPVRNAGYY
jgi:protein-tyrosine kinase